MKFPVLVCVCIASFCAAAADFVFEPPISVSRFWLGPDLWANPMPDWRLENGAICCDFPGGNRTAVVLTRELTSQRKPFQMRVTVEQTSESLDPRGGYIGFETGLQGRFNDYRDSAVFGRGFAAGIYFGGRLFIGDSLDRQSTPLRKPFKNLTLVLNGEPRTEGYTLVLTALDSEGVELGKFSREKVHPSWLEGLAAIAVSTRPPGSPDLTAPRPEFVKVPARDMDRGGNAQVRFRDLQLSGPKFADRKERAFGPILWTQYSLQNNGTLKLLAQFPPLEKGEFKAELELDGRKAANAVVEQPSSTALFKVNGLSTGKDHRYRVVFSPGGKESGTLEGIIRKIPEDRIKVAAFSCNDGTGFPHTLLVENVRAQKPDLLAFLGDQIYEGNGGYGALYHAGDRSIVDYLRKYFLHGWAWRELLRDIPSATIPDDHDVFHGNLWGNGGRAVDISRGVWAEAQDQGGYKMPPEFVNAVHRTQAGNLPDPFDPAPCDQGISVYYTRWEFGPIDFAIVADRQWKSAPAPLLPAANIYNGFARNEQWNPRTQADHPDAQLLGGRQEHFLKSWAADRKPGNTFRVVLSQTPWHCMATLPEEEHRSDRAAPRVAIHAPGDYPTNDVPTIDFDSNGWPKPARDLALDIMNQAGALLHLTGDQHLGSSGRYGIQDWDDGPYWIATPAIANIWPRRWFPREPGLGHRPGAPRYTGRYEDQFGNKITVLAAANPRRIEKPLPLHIGDRAPGYSIIRFHPRTKTVELENWPYWAGPQRKSPDNKPYEGWPIRLPWP